MANENWPEEWRTDLVRWTPKRSAEFSIAGIQFAVNKDEEVVTPSIVKGTFDEAFPDFVTEGEPVDAPPAPAEEEDDGRSEEAGVLNSGDAVAAGASGDAGGASTGGEPAGE